VAALLVLASPTITAGKAVAAMTAALGITSLGIDAAWLVGAGSTRVCAAVEAAAAGHASGWELLQ
jgi:hypothetical protein